MLAQGRRRGRRGGHGRRRAGRRRGRRSSPPSSKAAATQAANWLRQPPLSIMPAATKRSRRSRAGVDPADAQARARATSRTSPGAGPAPRGRGPERRRRLAVVDQLAVDVVLDHEQVLAASQIDERDAARGVRGSSPVGLWKVGIMYRQARPGGRSARSACSRAARASTSRPSPSRRHADDLDGVVAHRPEREVVGRRLDKDDVARRGEDRERLLQGLRVAAGHGHVVRARRSTPSCAAMRAARRRAAAPVPARRRRRAAGPVPSSAAPRRRAGASRAAAPGRARRR